ncbi:unnamed protein product [Fraxinus pennsylvanica]|uniref:ABC transporter domain-containing protein n=1 Tax=Fraxinus pennsylvanica TaxID=56036 RepID=A0AAD1YZW5_9LAMI|nr:unnamed protein product [Fraxinus pennsylvanica]
MDISSVFKASLLLGSRGAASEVDIENLGLQEQKKLLERLVNNAEEDTEKFLFTFKNRIDRVEIELPTIEVRFEHLNVETEVYFSGRVTYNGHNMEEFVPQRTAAYIGQHDVYIGEMTVRETLAFSARCQGQGAGSSHDMLAELLRREKGANIMLDPDIEICMNILGLDNCTDIIVGDQNLRGISGGQRKRNTTGEMLVGPAKVFFMDEISTGLDNSITYQVVNSIRQSVHILKGTALISLLQPEPETYDHSHF